MTTPLRAHHRWFVGLAFALTLALSGSGLALGAEESPEPTFTEVDVPVNPTAFVQVEVDAVDRQGNAFTAAGWGVIIDPTGIILAPAHLVAPDAPGVAIRYSDWNVAASVQAITVRTTPTQGGPASGIHAARVLAADGYLDVAVLTLDSPGVTFAAIGLSSATRTVGETAVVVDSGPLVPGGTITPRAWSTPITSMGTWNRIEADPAWMSTDLPGEQTAGGGVIITDASGLIIALPTFNPAYGPQPSIWGWLPDLLQPVLDAALTGATYTSPYVVPGTGNEAYLARGWSTALDPCETTDTDILDDYPAGTTRIAAAFDATSMTEGEDIFNVWWDPVERVLDAVGVFQWFGPPDDCVWAGLSANEGQSLANREYALSVFVGGTLRQVTFVRTEIRAEQPAGSLNVVGRVIDADTGGPVVFAFITVLTPETDIGTWFENPDDTQVAASAITDEEGAYTTEPPIAPGVYPFIIQAFGYQPIGGSLDLTQGGFLPDIALTSLE